NPGSLANKHIMSELMEMREYKELRDFTMLKEFESAVAVQTFSDKIEATLPKHIEQRLNDLARFETELREEFTKADLNTKNAKQVQHIVQTLTKEVKQYLEDSSHKIRGHIRQAIKQAQHDTVMVNTLTGGLFGKETGQGQNLNMADKMQLFDRIKNNAMMRKIAEAAGRFQHLALHYQSIKSKHGVDEIVDIEAGNDLNRIVPTELIFLDDPDLDLIFYSRYAQRQLLQTKMEGTTPKAKGPIIICIDNSESMLQNDRITWAKLFALGLMVIAKKQNRTFATVNFANENQIKVNLYPKKVKVEPWKLIHDLEHFFNGGTDYEAPMRKAMQILIEDPDFKEADIVFLTDGKCEVNPGFVLNYEKNKKKHMFRTIGILVDMPTKGLPFATDACHNFYSHEGDGQLLKDVYTAI
ncbi:VWA domain-containing protein, partial [Patescibacteria group bacterium]|nr:VWA domain-containing protein [Patescibacteria group bacterium]